VVIEHLVFHESLQQRLYLLRELLIFIKFAFFGVDCGDRCMVVRARRSSSSTVLGESVIRTGLVVPMTVVLLLL
jgi:hypothetical protein